jgi:hypothetical protein
MKERSQDIDYGGRHFKLNRIDALKQFHIVRRIGPTLAEMLPVLKEADKTPEQFDEAPMSEKLEMMAQFAGPALNGLSKLSDEDAELVLFGLLSSIEVKQPSGNWAKVVSGNMLMMEDLELPSLLQLAGHAFMFNVSNFFSGLPR